MKYISAKKLVLFFSIIFTFALIFLSFINIAIQTGGFREEMMNNWTAGFYPSIANSLLMAIGLTISVYMSHKKTYKEKEKKNN